MSTVADRISSRIINAGSALHQNSRFNVRFLGIPENISDFMSRQVKNVNPPAITFQTMEHNNRRARFQDVGKIDSEILSISFSSDDEGIIDAIIMSQVFRQKGTEVSGFTGTKENSKFDIKLEIRNTKGDVVRTETYNRCFISSLQKADLENSDAGVNSLYTLTIQYDSIDYSIEEENFILSS